jgi:hypothetical protein
MAKAPKIKAQPKPTKEQVLTMLKELSDEEVTWVLEKLQRQHNRRRKNWDWWRAIAGIGEGQGGAISEEHDRWVYVKDWEERNTR